MGLVVVLGGLTLSLPAYAASPGLPDVTFDGDGLWQKTAIDAEPGVSGLTVDSAGRVVLFGPNLVVPAATQSQLRRLQDDGSADPSFGVGGSLTFPDLGQI